MPVVNPGIRRLLASAIQRLFNGASFSAPLTHTAVPTRAATGTTATFTRATTDTWPNNDGLVTGVAGEIGFVGARRVRNLFTNTAWVGAITGTPGTPPTGWIADVGTGTLTVASNTTYANHNQITFTAAAQRPFIRLSVAVAAYSTYLLNVVVVGNASGEPINDIIAGSSIPVGSTESYQINGVVVAASDVPVAGDVIQYKVAVAATAGTINWRVGLGCQGAATGSVTVVAPQLEDVTGRTDQTTPSEYVSVGVESAPYYHGSFVDGVKCFPTDLSGNPLPTAYTYDAVSLNGVAGTYVSTPDSVAASITGDIELIWSGTFDSLAGVRMLISKATASFSYDFYTSAGVLVLRISTDGGTGAGLKTSTSAAVPGLATGTRFWLKASRVASTGVAAFAYSLDGATYTTVATSASGGSGNIFDNAVQVAVGIQADGASNPTAAKVYAAQIYNGINGTLAVDFNASRYAGGTTLTGSTGETWTLNGSAVIHPTNNPMLGYSAEGARTNLCLQGNAFTTTWLQAGTPSATQNAVGPDGATSAWTLTDNSAVLAESVYQDGALTAAAYTASVFVKKTSGAQASYPCLLFYIPAGTEMAACTIDTSNGVATAWTAYTGFTMASGVSSTCISYNADFWRVSLTKTGTVASHRTDLIVAGTTNAVQSTGIINTAAQGSAVFYGAQVELGSFASSYIPTTTVAVTRNADVLTYSSAGNILGTAGAAYAEVVTATAVNHAFVGFDSVNQLMSASSGKVSMYDGANQAVSGSSFPVNTVFKAGVSWGAGGLAATLNGATPGTNASFDGDAVNGKASIYIGEWSGGNASNFGTIRNVRIWQRSLSSSELQAITS